MSETINLGLFKHDERLEESDVQFNIRKSLHENWDKIDSLAGNINNEIETLQEDNTAIKKDILDIKGKNTTQDNKITVLEIDNETNKTDISNIKQEQITQSTAIQKNADDIALAKETIEVIQKEDTTQNELIKTLQEEKDAEIAQLQEKYNDVKKQLPERTSRGRIHTFKG